MKKSLILYAMLILFAFSCNGLQKNKNDTNEVEEENPMMDDGRGNDIFESSSDSTTTKKDSINF